MICATVYLKNGEIRKVRGVNQHRAINRVLCNWPPEWVVRIDIRVLPTLELAR